MRHRAIDTPQGKLIFRTEDGLLHAINEQGEQLLQAFRQGLSIDDVCTHFEKDAPPNECRSRLTKLWKQWEALNLLETDNTTSQRLPYKLLIQPGLEVIQIATNSLALFTYLQQFYQSVHVSADQIMVTITVYQAESNALYKIIVDGKKKYQSSDFGKILLATCFEIGEEATYEEPRLFIAHAAALTHGQNTWVMPAQSGSGKSTLTATLLKHGYQLINDDIVPVNHDGMVTALNLPLKIKSGAWSILEPLYPKLKQAEIILRTDELQMKNLAIPQTALCPAGSKHTVTSIVVPTFDPNQLEPLCKTLPPTPKLQAFLQAEPYFPHRLTRPYLQKILDWLEPIPAWSIRYSNSQQALQLLKDLAPKS